MDSRECPSDVDKETWEALPLDLKDEILKEKQRQKLKQKLGKGSVFKVKSEFRNKKKNTLNCPRTLRVRTQTQTQVSQNQMVRYSICMVRLRCMRTRARARERVCQGESRETVEMIC